MYPTLICLKSTTEQIMLFYPAELKETGIGKNNNPDIFLAISRYLEAYVSKRGDNRQQ